MKNVDYIIVGGGYAALFFAHQLLKNNKSFVIFFDGKLGASQVSAGLINPVVLKKFTTFWKAQEQIDFLKLTMDEIANYTSRNYFIDAPIHRIFHDENEKELWTKKSQSEELQSFLSSEFVSSSEVINPFQLGKVNQSGRLNVSAFFDGMFLYLNDSGRLINSKFDYSQLNQDNSTYQEYQFENIVFCEGIGVKENPYFKDIPVQPNKGHQLKVKLETTTDEKFTFKKKHFLFPLENGLHFYGGTYDRDDIDQGINESAVNQLKNGLMEIYPHGFEVKEVHNGFRPTVKDRRPILGIHSKISNFYVFNGLGARGILNGCYFSKTLFDFIDKKVPLPIEVDLKRFNV